jgi:outer membrane receptor protein involved in Fe transport
MRRRIVWGLLIFGIAGVAGADPPADPQAPAGGAAPSPTYTVEVREKRPVSAASAFVVDAKSFELRALESPGEILEVTPGLVTGQHAGGGKANQYLVRGFDADHGTDNAVFVDRVPVNMRSHAHGQGYTDLHFVIPETVERIEITKGTYDAEVGDFATAGSVNLITRETAEESLVKVELGEFDTQRYVGLWSPKVGAFSGADPSARGLFAFEAYGTDGPFASEEDFWRFAGFGRVGFDLGPKTRLVGVAHAYWADWDASNQIPQRAVDAPGFDRWDAVDPTDGGDSSTVRTLLKLTHEPSERDRIEAAAWLIRYDLDLFSNFSFFLGDPVRGDQIVQRDDRWVYGGFAKWRRAGQLAGLPAAFTAGLDTRNDDAHVRLARSQERDAIETVADDDIVEHSLAAFAEAEVLPLPWVRGVVGLRAEQFWFDVGDRSGLGRPDGHASDGVILPKANLILRPFAGDGVAPSELGPLRELELFLNFGQGFHSNDARDAVANPREPTLPTALGWEVGARTRLFDRLDLALAYWWLSLESELVFVGDEGVTEPRGRSRRRGIEASAELEITEWLLWIGDLAYSSAEFTNGDKVPQGARFVASSSVVARHASGLSAELRWEVQGERYSSESPSTPRLRSYSVWSLVTRYRRGAFEVSLAVQNLFDTEWESAEFFYESRLPGERLAGFEDFHFVPGWSRNFRVGLAYHF